MHHRHDVLAGHSAFCVRLLDSASQMTVDMRLLPVARVATVAIGCWSVQYAHNTVFNLRLACIKLCMSASVLLSDIGCLFVTTVYGQQASGDQEEWSGWNEGHAEPDTAKPAQDDWGKW